MVEPSDSGFFFSCNINSNKTRSSIQEEFDFADVMLDCKKRFEKTEAVVSDFCEDCEKDEDDIDKQNLTTPSPKSSSRASLPKFSTIATTTASTSTLRPRLISTSAPSTSRSTRTSTPSSSSTLYHRSTSSTLRPPLRSTPSTSSTLQPESTTAASLIIADSTNLWIAIISFIVLLALMVFLFACIHYLRPYRRPNNVAQTQPSGDIPRDIPLRTTQDNLRRKKANIDADAKSDRS